MKKVIILSVAVIAISMIGNVAQAQLINANTNASVDVGVGKKASTTMHVDASASTSNGMRRGQEATSTKEEFLIDVKAHAEEQSGRTLDNFAKGVLQADENVDSIKADKSHVEIEYKLPAKFLGIFSTSLSANTNVTFSTTTNGNGPKEVTVRFPWYRLFFSLDDDAQADVVKTAVETSVQSGTNANARTVQLISNILKQIRAKIEAKSEVNASN